MENNYDVVVLGGGLAGLTLSLQLIKQEPSLSVLVLERRAGGAPEAAHKVGESTVELGTHYLREVLNLKDYLDEFQLPKHGLRFFFSPKHKTQIDKRVELGPRELLPIPSHQIDRGTFENKLVELCKENSIRVLLGAKVSDVEINKEGHVVEFKRDDETLKVKTAWVVDASGRASYLKRKLNLKKELDHDINSAWFRIKGEYHFENWSDNAIWSNYVEPGLRRLSTAHFMDKGYWVWFIPLSSGYTSVGIVADPSVHPFDTFNTLEKAMLWLEKNEPLCFEKLNEHREDVIDFKVLKHFAHHSERLFDTSKWALTGEAGLFLDPFYSPGTDFIALNNTLVTDLIISDFKGEDIHLKTNVFERTMFALFDNWIPIYKNMYPLWGLTQTMVLKIFWDWATYWSIPTLLFTNNGYTNLSVLRSLFASEGCVGERFGLLNRQMQKLFLEWSKHDVKEFESRYIDPFDIGYLRDFHKGIDDKHSPQELINQVHKNMLVLEEIAASVFLLMSKRVHGTSVDMAVNPYSMSLENLRESTEGGVTPRMTILKEVGIMWFYDN